MSMNSASSIPSICLLMAILLVAIAVYRRWKRKPAMLFNLLSSLLIYSYFIFHTYGVRAELLFNAFRHLASYRQGQILLVVLILAPIIVSVVLSKLLQYLSTEKQKAIEKRQQAIESEKRRTWSEKEDSRQELRDMINSLNDFRLDISPFIAAVNSGGKSNPDFEKVAMSCKKHSEYVKRRCEQLNSYAEEENIPERANVFVR